MEGKGKHHDNTVWPPPPSGTVSLATWFPFRFLNLRVQGETSGFRGGWIGIEPSGMTIHGKVATHFPGAMLLWLVYVLTRHWMPHRFWLLVPAAVIVSALLLYLFRKSMTLTLPWSQVRQIILDQEKHRASIVYDALDRAGKTKTYSLVFALNAALYPSFVSDVEQYAPKLGLDDKLRGESMVGLLMLPLNALIIILGAVLLSWLIMGHH